MSSIDAGYRPGRLAVIAGALLVLLLGVTSMARVTPLGEVLDALVAAVGYDWIVPAILGVLTLLAGLVVLVSGRGATMQQMEMPTVERPVPVPSAGQPFDETIGGWRFATRSFGGDAAAAVRERLRSAAVASIAAEEGRTRRTARRLVDEGTWTDDEHATAFLAGRYTPLRTWLVALQKGQTGPEYRARRTVAAIRAIRDDRANGGERRTNEAESRTNEGENRTNEGENRTNGGGGTEKAPSPPNRGSSGSRWGDGR